MQAQIDSCESVNHKHHITAATSSLGITFNLLTFTGR